MQSWRHISIGSRRIPGVDLTISRSGSYGWALVGCLSVLPACVSRWLALASLVFDFAGSRANHTYTQQIRALIHRHTQAKNRPSSRCYRRHGSTSDTRCGELCSERSTEKVRRPRALCSRLTATRRSSSRCFLSSWSPFPKIDGNERPRWAVCLRYYTESVTAEDFFPPSVRLRHSVNPSQSAWNSKILKADFWIGVLWIDRAKLWLINLATMPTANLQCTIKLSTPISQSLIFLLMSLIFLRLNPQRESLPVQSLGVCWLVQIKLQTNQTAAIYSTAVVTKLTHFKDP